MGGGCRYARARRYVEREDSLQILFLTFLPCLKSQSFWGFDTRADPGSDVDSGASNSDHHADAAGLSND